MTRLAAITTAVVASTLLSQLALAGPTLTEVAKWYRSEWEAAHEFPDLSLVEIRYTVEYHDKPDLVELESMRRQVKSDDKHPLAYELRKRERQLTTPRVSHGRVWISDDENWRLNIDYEDDERHPFWDLVKASKWEWASTDDQLALFDPRVGFPEGRAVPSKQVDLILHYLRDLFHGGAQWVPEGECDLSQSSVQDGVFRLTIKPVDAGRPSWIVEGRWDASRNRGLISQCADTYSPETGVINIATIECSGWQWNPVLQRPVAETATWRRSDESVFRVTRFVGAAPVTSDEFARIHAIPSPVSGDAVRTGVRWESVQDFRPDPSRAFKHDPLAELPAVSGLTDIGTFRIIGWVSAGAIVMLILVLRRERLRSRPQTHQGASP